MISAEQFAEWKEHPVTREIFAELKRSVSEIKNQLSYGNTIGGSAEATHSLTSRAVGQLDGLNQLLNISYADGETEEAVGQEGY